MHRRDDVDRRYVPRKEGGRGLASIEDSVDASIRLFENYIKTYGVILITPTRNNTNNATEQTYWYSEVSESPSPNTG